MPSTNSSDSNSAEMAEYRPEVAPADGGTSSGENGWADHSDN